MTVNPRHDGEDWRVLVVDGSGNSEAFDPKTNSWSKYHDADKSFVSEGAAASTLEDGRLILCGGVNGNSAVNTCHVFNGWKNEWTNAADMNIGRYCPSATTLLDRRVVVSGGVELLSRYCSRDKLSSCEVYDFKTDRWSYITSMRNNRYRHSSASLSDGKVIVCGGLNDNNQVLDTCELYSSDIDIWIAVAKMGSARYAFAAAPLHDGRILVCGGVSHLYGPCIDCCEAYDTKAGRWSSVAAMSYRHSHHTATAMPDGRVLVCGGDNPYSNLNDHESSELYDARMDQWTVGPNFNFSCYVFSAALCRFDDPSDTQLEALFGDIKNAAKTS